MAFQPTHRPFQILTGTAVVLGLLPLAFAAGLGDPRALAGAFCAWSVAVYLGAAGGALLAATTFAPGEPMRPGWLYLGTSYLLLLPSRLLAGADPEGLFEGTAHNPVAVPLFSATSAALGVVGFLLLARAWRASGLDLTSRASRIAMRVAALAVALVAAGPDLVDRFPAATGGDPMAMVDVVTDVLDGALFIVAAPVLRAALALGGGLVVWPWGLLTLSLLAWLGYDAAAAGAEMFGLVPRTARLVEEVMRSLGACAILAAGLAQRWIMQTPPGSAAAGGPPRD